MLENYNGFGLQYVLGTKTEQKHWDNDWIFRVWRISFDVKKVFVVLFDQRCCATLNNLGFIVFEAAFKKGALEDFDRWWFTILTSNTI